MLGEMLVPNECFYNVVMKLTVLLLTVPQVSGKYVEASRERERGHIACR